MPTTLQVSVEFNPLELSYGDMRALLLVDFEKQFIRMLLDRHGGNLSKAAKEVRMDRKHLHYLAKKHGLRQTRKVLEKE